MNRHKDVINFMAFTKEGDFFFTRSKMEAIIWDTKTWKDVIIIEEDFGIVTSTGRRCLALIHDGLYKPWTKKVLKDFNDEYDTGDEPNGSNKQEHTEIREEDIRVTG